VDEGKKLGLRIDLEEKSHFISDKVVKSPYFSNLSFLRKSRAPRDYFNGFWTPAFAGVTDFGLFTRPSYLFVARQGVPLPL